MSESRKSEIGYNFEGERTTFHERTGRMWAHLLGGSSSAFRLKSEKGRKMEKKK